MLVFHELFNFFILQVEYGVCRQRYVCFTVVKPWDIGLISHRRHLMMLITKTLRLYHFFNRLVVLIFLVVTFRDLINFIQSYFPVAKRMFHL